MLLFTPDIVSAMLGLHFVLFPSSSPSIIKSLTKPDLLPEMGMCVVVGAYELKNNNVVLF